MSHMLSQLGLEFGDSSTFVSPEENSHNPIFFEQVELNSINDEILAELGGSFIACDVVPAQPDFTDELCTKFRSRVSTFLADTYSGSARIGLKDPRFCFTLPLWRSLLREFGFELRCVITRRANEAVVASNAQVNRVLELEHNRRIAVLSSWAASYFVRANPWNAVDFDMLLDDPHGVAKQLSAFVGGDPNLIESASSVIEPRLRHISGQQEQGAIRVDEWVADNANSYAVLLKMMKETGLSDLLRVSRVQHRNWMRRALAAEQDVRHDQVVAEAAAVLAGQEWRASMDFAGAVISQRMRDLEHAVFDAVRREAELKGRIDELGRELEAQIAAKKDISSQVDQYRQDAAAGEHRLTEMADIHARVAGELSAAAKERDLLQEQVLGLESNLGRAIERGHAEAMGRQEITEQLAREQAAVAASKRELAEVQASRDRAREAAVVLRRTLDDMLTGSPGKTPAEPNEGETSSEEDSRSRSLLSRLLGRKS
ncbi:MAG TPA: hypothetical protein VF497_03680 [Rudaea sp.]